VDESLGFFKANVLFKHFEVKGAADRVLIYLTLYTTQCLKRLETCAAPADGLKALTAMAHESFTLPGTPRPVSRRAPPLLDRVSAPPPTQVTRASLLAGSSRSRPARRNQVRVACAVRAAQLRSSHTSAQHPPGADLCRGYLRQVREELGKRLVAKVYDENGQPSKFWLVFAKRKFMNKTL